MGLHAEEALEPGFNSLSARAEAAGWSQDETAFALHNLALARVGAAVSIPMEMSALFSSAEIDPVAVASTDSEPPGGAAGPVR